MSNQRKKWFFLIILAIVWGSSFILMKKALLGFTQLQLGALRILITAFFLLLVGWRTLKKVEKEKWIYIFYTALLGTFFPAFLFAYALKELDSSISAILNSLTPFHTFILGALFFGFGFKRNQFVGIFIGLVGSLLLILEGASLNPDQNYWFVLLVMISSFGYAINANLVKKHLQEVNALAIVTGNFLLLIIPTSIVLWYAGFFTEVSWNAQTYSSFGYLVLLALVGTGIAKVMFNRLVQISTPVFSSSVTYLIPVVAVIWGMIDGEKLSLIQLFAGGIILFGVYLVNRTK